MTAFRRWLVSSLVAWCVGGCAPPPADGIAFDNVTVIDAVNGTRTAQRVVVRGERIALVLPTAQAAARPDARAAEVVDGTGRYLIPGLWDMHVHFLYDPELTDAMSGLFLRYGITSVRDTGGDMAQLAALRARLEAGPDPAPRMFIAGPLLDGHFVVYDGADPGRPPLGTAVDAPLAAERTVAALDEAGADLIKIYELVSPEVFGALVDAARRHHLPIAAHVPLTMVADEAGARVDSMEHLRNVELACAGDWRELLEARRARIQAFEEGRGFDLRAELHQRQRGVAIAHYDEARCDAVLTALADTIQVPTLRLNTRALIHPEQRADWPDALARLPQPVAARWRAAAAESSASGVPEDTTFERWSLFLTGRMHAHGLTIGAGTDTPIRLGIPGYSLHTELALLVQSGLSPLEALAAATVTPPAFFGLEDGMGTIAPGMAADLVLLSADPLADIENTRRIAGVMSRGRWLPAVE